MKGIISRPLLKEWTTAQISNPVLYSTRSFSGCRRPFSAKSHVLVRRHVPPFSLSLAKTNTLYYSTLPDQTSVKSKRDVPPPSTPTSKKPKVDLRPAPKKPDRETTTHVKPSHLKPSPPQPKPPLSPRTTATNIESKSSPGPTKAMQHDIAEATKHGIITPPPEGVGRLQRLWHQFVQLAKFYWGGLKMIFITHRQLAADIRRRDAEAKARGDGSILTRWEVRFLQTYNRDLVKLVPFVLTLVVLEEALPFIVLYAPGLLPSTCLLPSQRERIEVKRRAKQIEHLNSVRTELLSMGQHAASISTEHGVRSLSLGLARAVSGAFSQSTWGPLFLQQRRIKRRLDRLSADDALLVKEDFGARLKEEELVEALEERGLVPDAISQHMRAQLEWWLRGAQDDKTRLGLVLQATTKGTGGNAT